MKHLFYPKIAWMGMKNNRKLYIPYVLTCVGMIMMFYILAFLTASNVLASMAGGDFVQNMLGLGRGICLLFALIFLFYTNSFLIRRRKKEFGLYNILGMGKWNLARVMLWESLMISGIAFVLGLGCGILFSKLAELAMVNILKNEADFSLSLNLESVLLTLKSFAVVFLLIFLNALRQIRKSNPIELLHSENAGEKPPKANWFLALIGALCLGFAYFLAVMIEDPVASLLWFFFAVALVIVATYLLFMAGSVTFCRFLQKRKGYYYKTSHFVSVSSMVYRMKRNGAGLASICILSTMVLVMISATASLYVGMEDSIRNRYPRHINVHVNADDPAALEQSGVFTLQELSGDLAAQQGMTIDQETMLNYRSVAFGGYVDGEVLRTKDPNADKPGISLYYADLWQIFFVPIEDYNRMMGKQEVLEPGEALIYSTKGTKLEVKELSLEEELTWRIKDQADSFVSNGEDAMSIVPSLFVFVNNFEETAEKAWKYTNDSGNQAVIYKWEYEFDLDGKDEEQIAFQKSLQETADQMNLSQQGVNFQCDGSAENRGYFYGMYGGLFFLGILLGIVFVFAAVLIMYYKQISEGYEDQSRFEIMQKVGMTRGDIKKSINSQVLTVFFLPLLAAGVHLGFAFPFVWRILLMFGLKDQKLLILVTVCCYLIFALFYTLVYRITSGSYYSIVSGKKGR